MSLGLSQFREKIGTGKQLSRRISGIRIDLVSGP